MLTLCARSFVGAVLFPRKLGDVAVVGKVEQHLLFLKSASCCCSESLEVRGVG